MAKKNNKKDQVMVHFMDPHRISNKVVEFAPAFTEGKIEKNISRNRWEKEMITVDEIIGVMRNNGKGGPYPTLRIEPENGGRAVIVSLKPSQWVRLLKIIDKNREKLDSLIKAGEALDRVWTESPSDYRQSVGLNDHYLLGDQRPE